MTARETRVATLLGRPVERIAVVRALYLGDLLLAVPALRALRAGYPTARITLIGLPWARGFVHRFGRYLDDFAELSSFPGIAEVADEPRRAAEFVAKQREQHYDLVVQMHGSGRTSNRLATALGGAITAGYHERGISSPLDIGAPYPTTIPEVDRNLELAAMLGCPIRDRGLEFPIADADVAEAQAILDGLDIAARPLIGIHPGAKFAARRWMPERFAGAASVLAHETGAAVVVTGSASEVALAGAVAVGVSPDAHTVAGRTSIGGLAALISRMTLFISNDTGPAHIAAALGTPSVTVFGPADIRRWAPEDDGRRAVVRHPVACSPCDNAICPIDHRCLRSIGIDEVVAAARRVMEREEASCVA